MRKFFTITIIGSLCLLFFSCKLKNPVVKENKDPEKKFTEDGLVTSNVISTHNFVQRPYDHDIKNALSSYSSMTFVASDESTAENLANPTLGCRRIESPKIFISRLLDIGTVTITETSSTSHSFESREIGNYPFQFSESLFLTDGVHNIQSSGLKNGILRLNSDFIVSQLDPEIEIEIDNGENILQPIDFPSISNTLGVVTINRGQDTIIHVNPPANLDFIRVYIGDQEVSHVCYYSPQSTLLRIPSSTLSQIGSLSSSSENGIIYIDFVNRVLTKNAALYMKQLYIESTVRHVQGFEDFGSFQLRSGILKFL